MTLSEFNKRYNIMLYHIYTSMWQKQRGTRNNKGICESCDKLSISTIDPTQRFTINEVQQFQLDIHQ